MPTYCYRAGDIIYHVPMSYKEMKRLQKKDGTIVLTVKDKKVIGRRDYPAEHIPRKSTGDGAWPIHSEAAAVNPEDIPRAMADARRHGVPTTFDREGRPILRSRAHRKAYLQYRGFFDRDAGYGDAARRTPEPEPKKRSRRRRERTMVDLGGHGRLR